MHNIYSIENKCVGCGSCYLSCPQNAIKMQYDDEGFQIPIIDENICISCGKCIEKCPVANVGSNTILEPDVYAFSAEDRVTYKSSSGGVFTVLAEYIISRGGIVCGASYDDEFICRHMFSDNLDDLDKLKFSKYVQSSTENTYVETEKYLELGRNVLYTGTPCQIAGLYSYLGKEYKRLYTVDLVCHGVPSPGVFGDYLSNEYGGKSIKEVRFRERESQDVFFYLCTNDGKRIEKPQQTDDYLQLFLNNIDLRYSCYDCQFSKLPRIADITIGDLWAKNIEDITIPSNKKISVVTLNNKKGRGLFDDSCHNSKYVVTMQKLDIHDNYMNSNIFESYATKEDLNKRNFFFDIYYNEGYKNATKRTLNPIGITGYWFSNNYGAVCTSYALYTILRENGFRSVLIDAPKSIFPDWHNENTSSRLFIKEKCEVESEIPNSFALRELNERFACFVTGSDSIWGLQSPVAYEYEYYCFLGFADNYRKKISYATSIGSKYIHYSAIERSIIKRDIEKYDAISVREESGVAFLKKQFGVSASWLIDPVFLPHVSLWESLGTESDNTINEEKYVLVYILQHTKEKDELIAQYIEQEGVSMRIINDLYEEEKEQTCDNKPSSRKIANWISAFRNAKCVITDSYHGVCFSIIFHKEFVTLPPKGQGDRIDSLLNLFDLKYKKFDYTQAIQSIMQKGVDWDRTENIILREREKGISFLLDSIKSGSVHQESNAGRVEDSLNSKIDIMISSSYQKIDWVTNYALSEIKRANSIFDRMSGAIIDLRNLMIREIVIGATQGKRVAIKGGGIHTEKLLGIIKGIVDIDFIIDRQRKTNIEGFRIINDSEILNYDIDVVIISSYKYRKEMRQDIEDNCKCEVLDIYNELENKGLVLHREFYLV